MSDPLSFEQVLEEELRQIDDLRVRRRVRARPPVEETRRELEWEGVPATGRSVTARAHLRQLVGLAFSGGGIRSATFNLGILQSLARLGLLHHFDYLSTVSGGGYIGSWLTAWVSRNGLTSVVDSLRQEHTKNPKESATSGAPESAGKVTPIAFLRKYSNYLTPQTGFFSLDTWMAAATYLRNLILNLNVLILTMATVLLLPRLFVAFAFWVQGQGGGWWSSTNVLAGVVVVLSLVVAWSMAIKLEIAWTTALPRVAGARGVLLTAVLPLFLIALLVVYWTFSDKRPTDYWYWGLRGGIAFLGFWLVTGLFWWGFWIRRGLRRNKKGLKDLGLWIASLVAAFLAGAGGSWLLWLLVRARVGGELAPEHWLRITVWAPPGVVLTLVFAGVYFVGLMGRHMPEEERQWWSRLGAFQAILAAGWLGLFLMTFYAPPLLRWAASMAPTVIGSIGLGWLLSTALGVIAGRSPATKGQGTNRWLQFGAEVAPFIFVLGLLMLLSLGIDEMLPRLLGGDAARPRIYSPLGSWSDRFAEALRVELDWTAGWMTEQLLPLSILVVVLVIVTGVLSRRVDVNEFSMHNFYRDRLTRAYLGASRERSPNPFTGFDREDDLDLTQLLADGKYDGPYPILNAALNLTSGRTELAWQERKASSFVFTPRHHGFERSRASGADKAPGAYRESDRILQGTEPHKIALGTAMTVSGAAVNPNMGYHSSPALAFLLTVFNARLGLWMGNPAHPTAWRRKAPTFSLAPLLNELLGQTGAASRWINLADGGFFDNLGVYELVRRRCRFILACDAEGDPDLEFNALGNVIRRCRSDFGVEIRFENLEPLKRRPDSPFSRWHCAVGTIHYERVDENAPKGILVYVKSSLTGDEPADVLNYRRKHEEFPHQSTADQWFDESQFESYRRLGQHVGEVIFEAVGLRPRG